MKKRFAVLIGVIVMVAVPAHAYIGPGVGATMIGWFVGFVVTMGAAVSALIVWPLRMLRSRRRDRNAIGGDNSDSCKHGTDKTNNT